MKIIVYQNGYWKDVTDCTYVKGDNDYVITEDTKITELQNKVDSLTLIEVFAYVLRTYAKLGNQQLSVHYKNKSA